MKENYLITIEGFITADGDTDNVSLTTLGSYQMKNGKHYIVYKLTYSLFAVKKPVVFII